MPIITAFKILFCLFALAATSCSALDVTDLKQAGYTSGKLVGELKYKGLNEASGIARSTRSDKLFWVINDGGDKPFIYAIGSQGKHLGRYFVTKVDNRDWEDISSYSENGKHYLIIADTGDNNANHLDSFLWVVEEPNLQNYNKKQLNTIPVKQRIRFRYKDGPRDCESIAVDQQNQRILLLSKRTVPAVMYQLPLSPDPKQRMLTATPMAELNLIPQPGLTFLLKNPFFGRYASQPTAIDISPSGKELAVLTYGYGYIFELQNNKWEQALEQAPKVIEIPRLAQAEAWSFDNNGNLIITSEKRPAPLYLLKKSSIEAISQQQNKLNQQHN